MLTKIKNFFKLNIWKRWFILVFIFIGSILFIGLSFGLYSKKSSATIDYKNGIQVTIKPSSEADGTSIVDGEEIENIQSNLSNRLNIQFPNSNTKVSIEKNNVIDIKATNINNEFQKDDFLDKLTIKEPIVITQMNGEYDRSFIDNSLNNNNKFIGVSSLSSSGYSLSITKSTSNEIYKIAKAKNIDYTLIWRNFEILKQIAEQDEEFGSAKYGRNLYSYLFVDGLTPEKKSSNEEFANTPVLFKDKLELVDKDGKITTYKPTDFLVSKNSVDSWKDTSSLSVSKDFGLSKSVSSFSELEKEYVSLRFWLSSYALNNYLFSFVNSNTGNNAYIFLIITLVSIYAVISIFVVINYGYLGIFAIMLLSIIIFLSLLMITVFIGDYDPITIFAIVSVSLIALEFIVSFFERIKKENKKENSIPKAIKNSIKLTNKIDYLKSFGLLISMIFIYLTMSNVFYVFNSIVLSTMIFIPIIMIMLMKFMAYLIAELPKVQNSSRVISFLKPKKEEIITKTNLSNNNPQINTNNSGEITIENKNDLILNQSKSFSFFSRNNKKMSIASFSIIGTIIIAGLITFLTLFGLNKNVKDAFKLGLNEQERLVLRIGKPGNNDRLSQLEVNEIKNDLVTQYGIKSTDIKITPSKLLYVYLNKGFDKDKISQIENDLSIRYGVLTIPSEFVNSNTFKIMKFTMYAILVAIVAICLFVLFWMRWTKALTLFISMVVGVLIYLSLIALNIVVLTPFVSVVSVMAFIFMLLTQLSSLINYNQKLKKLRIEEHHKDTLKPLFDKFTFSNLKILLINNALILFSILVMALFLISSNSLALIVLMIFVILNLLFTIFILPKILILFESIRARKIRNRILNNYWDTEKVKEQSFSEINNIK